LLLVALDLAFAAPNGPNNIDVIRSERMKPMAGAQVPAQAGNVTELNINATSVTKSWQGYFGNITGMITLDDARNKTMYQWSDVSPQGEVFASPAQIADWTHVKCFNYSAKAPELNLSALEKSLNIRPTDGDGVNETFSRNFAGSFYVGATHISGTSGCKAVYTFAQSAPQTVDFVEVLLTDSSHIIYSTLIENNAVGFDDRSHDFQMIVGEDGHNGNTATTLYYFYVELE